MPPVETTYMCAAKTFDESIRSSSYHVIGTEIIVGNPNVLHHLVVYGCPDDVGTLYTNVKIIVRLDSS